MKRRNFIAQSSLLGTAAALSPAEFLQAHPSKGHVRADQIKNIPVLRTIVDGKTVYEA